MGPLIPLIPLLAIPLITLKWDCCSAESGGWGSAAMRWWPKLKCVLAVRTGSFALYEEHVRRYAEAGAADACWPQRQCGRARVKRRGGMPCHARRYLGGNVPLYSPLYAATEGLLGVNTDLHGTEYTLHPRVHSNGSPNTSPFHCPPSHSVCTADLR